MTSAPQATASTPQIVDVEVTPDRDDACCFVHVQPVWSGVDRPKIGGWACRTETAPRLVRAIKAGVVYGPATVATDVDGKTYAQAASKILGRTMHADLKRLGF